MTGSTGADTFSSGTTRKPAGAVITATAKPRPTVGMVALYYPQTSQKASMSIPDDNTIHAFRTVPRTGVIYVTTEAARLGYRTGAPDWCNLGQGQPETGPLPGAPPRIERVSIDVDDQEYAPVPGIGELRAAIADLYNPLYRRGMQ